MNAKKLVSMILALVMLLALGTSAMAEAETTYAYQYEIYQIFTGDYANGVLSNVKWGQNGTGTVGEDVDATILEELTDVNSKPDTEKLAKIKTYVNLGEDSTPFATVDTDDNPANISKVDDKELPNGYYLVKDKANTQNGENKAYTTYVVQVVNGTLIINRKVGVPTAEKKIVEDNSEVDANEASIGETVNYKITGTLPSNIKDYNTYYYVFNDTLSKGLTYTANSVKVTVGDVDVTKYFYVNETKNNEDDTTSLTVGIQDLLALQNVENLGITISASTEVVVTYSAVLNENAEVENGNTNTVKLEYSNDPNNSGEGKSEDEPEENPEDEPTTNEPTGETPEDTVKTYTTELIIKKVDENGNALTGAGFTLKGEGVKMVVITIESFEEADDGTYYKLKDGTYTETAPTDNDNDSYEDLETKYKMNVTTTTQTIDENVNVTSMVGDDGIVKFTGLGAGDYTISETTTPAGYNSMADITVKVEWNNRTGAWSYKWSNDPENENNTNTVTIVNKSGATLPSTGGMGTTVLYIAGGLLVAAAVIMMITRRRAGAAE